MLKGIGKRPNGQTVVYIGLDVHNIDLLMRDQHLEIKAEPEHGLPLDIVILYGPRQDDIIRTLLSWGVELPETIQEHDIDKKQEQGS